MLSPHHHHHHPTHTSKQATTSSDANFSSSVTSLSREILERSSHTRVQEAPLTRYKFYSKRSMQRHACARAVMKACDAHSLPGNTDSLPDTHFISDSGRQPLRRHHCYPECKSSTMESTCWKNAHAHTQMNERAQGAPGIRRAKGRRRRRFICLFPSLTRRSFNS